MVPLTHAGDDPRELMQDFLLVCWALLKLQTMSSACHSHTGNQSHLLRLLKTCAWDAHGGVACGVAVHSLSPLKHTQHLAPHSHQKVATNCSKVKMRPPKATSVECHTEMPVINAECVNLSNSLPQVKLC